MDQPGSRAAPGPWSITHVLAPALIGGLERVVQQLARGQHAGGSRVAVLAILDAGDDGAPFLGPLEAAGITVTRLELAPRAYLAERRQLAAFLGSRRPDVVHTHGYRADVQGGAVASRLRIPLVTTVHGFTGGGWKNRLYEWLQVAAFRRFAAVVAVSESLAARLRASGVAQERLRVVPNAAPIDEPPLPRSDARERLGVRARGFVAGWVGRLSEEKGADVFFRGLAQLADAEVTGVMVGVGRERESLGALAAQLGIADRVIWAGTVAEAGRLFTAFDCFVLSSRTEGTPIVLFEAMAAEVAIVATAVGGVPQVVSSAEALLVPPEDPTALAAAIRTVLTDPNAARERARRALGRLRTERGLAPWLARYDEIYRQVLSG